MFGYYHDSDRCYTDLWAPKSYHECENMEGLHCAIDNRAFSCYAKHEQEKEDIINHIVANYNEGITDFSLDLDDWFDEGDLEYIKEEVQRRIY